MLTLTVTNGDTRTTYGIMSGTVAALLTVRQTINGWTDEMTPRTERPARFSARLPRCPECGERNVRTSPIDGRVCAECEPDA